MIRPLFLIAGAVFWLGGAGQGAAKGIVPVADCAADQAIFAQAGQTIRVEIADTPAARAQGLMNVAELAPLSGMLFIYEAPQPAAFWMKNTLIPLDMIFMDAQGVIRHIHADAIPHDLTAIPGHLPDDPDPNRLMVLEIAGGEAARLNLTEGMAMTHPRLDQTLAAAPCP
ncbi:MAG: DUF192 domain-containing protein [Paracoccus sp. (in: a-proteobacteria)]|nr:DUF192 domain-containing protein [Paracoccus sp. (in: a-proteobacteria)]